MATTATTTQSVHKKGIGWLKTLGLVALAIIIISLLWKWTASAFKDDGDEGEARGWRPVAQVTCKPEWNADGGWCELGTFPSGKYRVVPLYTAWQMQVGPSDPPLPTDVLFRPVPPEGLDLMQYMKKDAGSIKSFLDSAPLKSDRYGALIVKINGQKTIEALTREKVPRTFTLERETTVSANINLPSYPSRYSGNEGELRLEVQAFSD